MAYVLCTKDSPGPYLRETVLNAFLCKFAQCLSITLQDAGSGLVAAAMISIVPGYISRSVAGSYDNEGIAIFCMLFTYAMWIKSVKTGSIFWGVICSLAYFYMVSICATFFVRLQFYARQIVCL